MLAHTRSRSALCGLIPTLWQLGQRLSRVLLVLRHLLLQPCQFPRHCLPLSLKGVVGRRNLLHQLANGCLRMLIALLQLPQVLHALVDLGLEVLQQLALVAMRPPIQQLCGSGRRQ